MSYGHLTAVSHYFCFPYYCLNVSFDRAFIKLFKSFLYFHSITDVPIFPLFPPLSIPPSIPTVNSHIIVHVHGLFIHVLPLVSSPSFHHYHPPTSGHCQSVPCFHACGSILFLSLFFSLDSSHR